VAIIKKKLLRVGTPKQLQTSLYGRQVEVSLRSATLDGSGRVPITQALMNDLAVEISAMEGVGDVSVAENRLYISMDEPDEVTPSVIRCLVLRGLDITKVAEVEYSLERAYLDLVARADGRAIESKTERRGVAA
jgi:hypothetical protein